MDDKLGYVYIRTNPHWDHDNLCKLGITENLVNRSDTYKTSESWEGIYVVAIEIAYVLALEVEIQLHAILDEYRDFHDWGTEIFDKCIIPMVKDIVMHQMPNDEDFKDLNPRLLTEEELGEIRRKLRENLKDDMQKWDKLVAGCRKRTERMMRRMNIIKIRDYQQEVLNGIQKYYSENRIGQLLWACGLGKTAMSIFIVKYLRAFSTIIGVPRQNLQEQFAKDILKILPAPKSEILFVGGIQSSIGQSTTDLSTIMTFFKHEKDGIYRFIITTYTSCELLEDIPCDMKIGDEAHHLTGKETVEDPEDENTQRGYLMFHRIQAYNTLFMTFTPKSVYRSVKFNCPESTTDGELYSMNDEEKFGKIIDDKPEEWAIENGFVTNFNVITIRNTDEELNMMMERNRLQPTEERTRIFLAVDMTIRAMIMYPQITHDLLYLNTQKDADIAQEFITKILELPSIPGEFKKGFYNKAIYSKNGNTATMQLEMDKFEHAPRGIVSCVYIMGEGTDLPFVNAVTFGSNMVSTIRIIQSALRSNRLDHNHPDKIAYIILPYCDSGDFTNEHGNLVQVRTVIAKLSKVVPDIVSKIKMLVAVNHSPKQFV